MKKRESEANLRLVPGGTPEAETDHPSSWSRPHVRSLAIASGKGGVGKSTLAANLALALGERGARVLLVDADFSQANLDLLLGVHPRWDLSHVLQGEKSLEEIPMERAVPPEDVLQRRHLRVFRPFHRRFIPRRRV